MFSRVVSRNATLLLFLLFTTHISLQPLADSIDSASTFGHEHVGIAAPLFPTDGHDATSCYAYSLALLGTGCNVYASETLPVTTRHCPLSSGAGVLVLQRGNTTADELPGTAVYRLRVVGPDGVWLLEPIYCRQDLALANYNLTTPGRYSVEVLMLHTSFMFGKPNASKAVANPWAGYVTLDVQPSNAPGSNGLELVHEAWGSSPDMSVLMTGSHVASEYDNGEKEESLPLCPDSGPLPGRWRFGKWPHTDAAPLLQTCMWGNLLAGCNTTPRLPMMFEPHPATLYWQPHGCRVRAIHGVTPHPSAEVMAAASKLATFGAHHKELAQGQGQAWQGQGQAWQPRQLLERESRQQQLRRQLESDPSAVTANTCLPPGRHLCFIGDSHTRYLSNSLLMWRGGYQQVPDIAAKQLLMSESTSYYKMLFGWDMPELEEDGTDPLARNCTDVVINFGQWPASYRAGPAPFSAVTYLRLLLRLRRRLLALRQRHGVRVFWVTTALSSLKARFEAAGVDWRTDPLLLLYNRLAADVMSGAVTAPDGFDSDRQEVGSSAGGRDHLVHRAVLLGAGREGVREDAVEAEGAAATAPAEGAGAGPRTGTGVYGRVGRELRRRWSWLTGWGHRVGAVVPGGKTAAARGPYGHMRRRRHQEALQVRHLRRKVLQASLGKTGRQRVLGPVLSDSEGADTGEAIPIIDTWSPSRILHDTTWDGIHYVNTGVVGMAQFGVLLHALCSEPVLEELAAGRKPGG